MPGQTAKPVRSIGVLTGGGDVPGLNAAIKALVYHAEPENIRVTGLRSGWEGITFLDRSRGKEGLIFQSEDPNTWQGHYLMPFTRLNTRNIDRSGGTVLLSTRTNPANIRVSDLPPHLASYSSGHGPGDRVDLTDEVLANLEFLELDGLVIIGGDDTLSYGAVLAAKGVPVWGIPKTMDNDVPGPITASASKPRSAGQQSSSVISVPLPHHTARPSFSACLGVTPASQPWKPPPLPGPIVS